MLDGLWTVHYNAEGYRGAGVAVLINGRLYGGDSGFTYLGTYTQTGDSVAAEIKAKIFESAVAGIMGLSNYTLSLQGRVTGDVITGSGTTSSRPGVTLDVRMERVSLFLG